MVHFLTTLILALIIFIPACAISSRLLQFSEQARDNFVDIIKELTDFANEAKTGERKGLLLILDEGSAIVFFEKDKKEMDVNANSKLGDYVLRISRPAQCLYEDKNCLCLLRTAQFTKEDDESILATPQDVLCTDLDYDLEIESCNIGKPTVGEEGENIYTYVCSGGFMIDRNLGKSAGAELVYGGQEAASIPRRSVLDLTKFEDSIRIAGEISEQ